MEEKACHPHRIQQNLNIIFFCVKVLLGRSDRKSFMNAIKSDTLEYIDYFKECNKQISVLLSINK